MLKLNFFKYFIYFIIIFIVNLLIYFIIFYKYKMGNIINKSINFCNKTNLPISVEGWKKISKYLNILKHIIIIPNTECIIYSENGEWYINTLYLDDFSKNIWLNAGYTELIIGKFSCIPSFNNNYSLMNTNNFTITNINNTIIFNYL